MTVTVAEADLLVSATDVAVIVAAPAAVAVNNPDELNVPTPLIDQVTDVSLAPVTVAVNCFVAPTCTAAAAGDTLTATTGVGGGGPPGIWKLHTFTPPISA